MADKKLLSIVVKLGTSLPSPDVFELVMVTGHEFISKPYQYDVTLFQRKKDSKPIDPRAIINSTATIHINKNAQGGFNAFRRLGVFEYFEKHGTSTKHPDFRLYTGRIVPPFKLLDREVLFRVFENQDVVSILKTCLKGVQEINTGLLETSSSKFPKMEYCVQFGESTYAFLSRLMARYGIHYFFDHRGNENDPQNDTMIFGHSLALNQQCQEDLVDIVLDEHFEDTVAKRTDRIAGLVQRFDPAFRDSSGGNFNVLAPTNPFLANKKINPGSDLFDPGFGVKGGIRDFMREEFPAPVDSKADMNTYVTNRQTQAETYVATLAGRGNNRTFIPGRTIKIRNDSIHTDSQNNDEGGLGGKTFLLEYVSFSALEPIDDQTFWDGVGAFFVDVFKSAVVPLLTGGIAASMLQTYLTNRQESRWKDEDDPALATLGAGPASFAAIAGAIVPSLIKVTDSAKVKFNNSFFATVTQDKLPLKVPSYAPRPTAYGPHLATVIGDDGTDTAKGEISADPLGRVRVRFPWDLGPRREGISDNPFATGKNTCWVRVAQGWAGRNFGAQFLPRIGHEVVVEFLDGDPERPIITGSVYNADLGKPNLPFAAFKDGPKDFGEKDLFTHTGLGSFQRSGIKTQITPSKDAKQGFHALRFDDTHKSEQVLLRSQGRYDLTAFRHHFDTTHGNRHVLVKGGKDAQGGTLAGSSFNTTAGEYDLHVGGDRYEGIDKVANLTVKADVVHDLQTTSQTMVGTTASLNAMKIILEAKAKITLKVGGSFVVLDPSGVFISGPLVQINSGGSPDSTTDADITDPADATQADPGDPPNFLDLQPKGGGGGSRKRKVKAKHGFACKMNPDGSIQVTKAIKVNATDPAYASAVIADLSTMDNTKTGKALLDSLDASGKSVTVRPLVPAPKPSNAFATPTNGTAAANGTGSDSTVDYNPGDWPDPTTRTKPPGDVILFHELTHADHNAKGTNASSTTRTDNFTNDEEFNTIGPENKYRDERGHPRRNDHTDL
jgi:uncharacterized protein involved in type VI secretion and phage assembly